ncbi:histidine kinase dimerization/phospho-acceptor domain-containing protein [Desulfothermus sp.]
MTSKEIKLVLVTKRKRLATELSEIFKENSSISLNLITDSKETALDLAARNQVDLILIDWNREKENPFKDVTFNVPIVFIFPEQINDFLKNSALEQYGYIVYPFNNHAVLNTLHLAIEKFNIQKELNIANRIKALSIFAAGIAHDFNNLLGAIIGYAELLKFKTRESKELSRYVDLILRASDKAKNLVDKLAQYSRNWENMEKRIFPFHVILKETLRIEKFDVLGTISIIEDINKECDEIYADPSQTYLLCQSLLKTLKNIVKPDTQLKISLKNKKLEDSDKKIVCLFVEAKKQDFKIDDIEKELGSRGILKFIKQVDGKIDIVNLDDDKIKIAIFIPGASNIGERR